MNGFTESVVEEAALAWLESLGYAILHGPDIAVGELAAERSDSNYRDVVLGGRLRQALVRLNLDMGADALEDAFRKLTRTEGPPLLERNRAVHRMLVDGSGTVAAGLRHLARSHTAELTAMNASGTTYLFVTRM